MSEDQVYKDGDIVWVKLGNNWWPGEVIDAHRHPDGIVTNIKRKLYCIVKFFNENAYEYVSNVKQIYPFQSAKKEEFIKKGLSLYKSGNKFMEKFPEDVEVAERLTRQKVPSLFINDRPDSIVKAILGQPMVLTGDDGYNGSSAEYREKRRSCESITKIINITPNKPSAAAPPSPANPIRIEQSVTAASSSNATKNNAKNISISANRISVVGSDTFSQNNNNYRCNLCNFTSIRQNVMILHRKMHSNRNGPLGMFNQNTTPNNNKNSNFNNFNRTDSNNTKVNKTIAVKTPCTTTMTTLTTTTTSNITENRSETSLTIPETTSSLTINETTNENANSSKMSSSSSAVAVTDCCSSSGLDVPTVAPKDSHSRRSMRHLKTASAPPPTSPTEHSALNGSTLSIDLPETIKPIKKIPKKRDFANLNLQQEEEIPAVVQEVHTPAAEIATTPIGSSTETPTVKGNAEKIRNMLLADWSDEDETPEQHDQDKNEESGKDDTSGISKEMTSLYSELTMTSTPSNTTNQFLNTGRIRNIPKKDRRDVILHDFSGDLSMIEPPQEASSEAALVVHVDSSNSSTVEVVEEQQPPIITINDDDENVKEDKASTDNTKKKLQTNNKNVSPSRHSDMENVEPNDKSICASILSCFDFQDDEDDNDIDAPTTVSSSIAHFKKKYLSSERSSQNQTVNEDGARAKHEERAHKDRQLAAEIESLLQQTQPPPADVLNSTNSFDESIAVKDLPIKERSKRIFKSRNRSRIETKSSTESLTNSTSTDESLTKDTSTDELKARAVQEERGSMENRSKKANESILVKSTKILEKSPTVVEIITVTSEDQSLGEVEKHLHNGSDRTEEEKSYNQAEESVEKNVDVASTLKLQNHLEENLIEAATIQTLTELATVEEIKEESVVEEEQLARNFRPPPPPADVKEATGGHELKENLQKPPFLESSEFHIDDKKLTTQINPIPAVLESDDLPSSKNADTNEVNQEISHSKVAKENQNVVCDEKINETVVENVSTAETTVNQEQYSDKEFNEMAEIQVIQIETTSTSMDVEEASKSREEFISSKENKINGTTQDICSELTTTEIEERDEVVSEENCEVIEINSDRCCQPPAEIATISETGQQPHAEEYANHRMATTSPIDENSSMCASDTGAEFGSPASMLSEERLPAFPFSRNETPQQEIDARENEGKLENVKNINDSVEIVAENAGNEKSPNLPTTREGVVNENELLDTKAKEDRASTSENLVKGKDKVNSKSEETKYTDIKTASGPAWQSIKDIEALQRGRRRHIKNTPKRNIKEVFKSYVERLQMSKKALNEESKNVPTDNDLNASVSHRDLDTTKKQQQEENSEKSEELQDITKSEASTNREIQMPDDSDQPKTAVEKVPHIAEESTVNNEITKNPKEQEEKILNSITDIPTENIEIVKEISDSIDKTPFKAGKSMEKGEINKVLSPKNVEDVLVKVVTDNPKECIETSTGALGSNVDCCAEKLLLSTAEKSNIENTMKPTDHYVEEIVDDSAMKSTEIIKNKTVDTATNLREEVCSKEDNANIIYNEKKLDHKITTKETENDKTINNPKVRKALEATEEEGNQAKPNEHILSFKSQNHPNSSNADKNQNEPKLEENSNYKETRKNPRYRQNKRSAETALLAKSKQRKQENEEETPRKDDDEADDNIKESTKSPSLKSSQVDVDESIAKNYSTEIPRKVVLDPIEPESRSLDHEEVSSKEISREITLDKFKAESPAPENPQENILLVIGQEKDVNTECKETNPLSQIAMQQKDLIIECETTIPTPSHVIDFDNMSPSPCPQHNNVEIECESVIPQSKNEIVENETNIIAHSDVKGDEKVDAAPIIHDDAFIDNTNKPDPATTVPKSQLISVESEDTPVCSKGETLADTPTASVEPEADNDKATHDFLIEFDNLVNQGTQQNVTVLNAEDIINNIIVEVQVDNNLHQMETNINSVPICSTTVVAPVVVLSETHDVANIDPPAETSQKPIYKQLTPIKRRQTICFDILRKRKVYDFEEGMPTVTSASSKRTAGRKMTMPDIDRPISGATSSFGFDRRRYSIEDNITPSYLRTRTSNSLQDDDELFRKLFTDAPSSRSSTDSSVHHSGKVSNPRKLFGNYESKGPTAKSNPTTKNPNSRNMKRKASQTKTTGRRLSMQSENPPLSKIPREATGCVAIQPKPPKTDATKVTTLNDNQISTAQQQLIQLQQQQPQIQSSSSIILNTSTNRTRKTHKSSVHNQQQQNQSNQLVVQPIQIQQTSNVLQQQQLQNQLITQLANPPNVLQFVTQPIGAQQQHIQQSNEGFIIATATPSEDENVIDSNTQLIALPTQPYPGYTETFLLCKVNGNTCKPVDNVPLYLNHQLNELVPIPSDVLEAGPKLVINDNSDDNKQENSHDQQMGENKANITESGTIPEESEVSTSIDGGADTVTVHQDFLQDIGGVAAAADGGGDDTSDMTSNNGILLNIEGQQVLLDAATFEHLLANPDTNTQLISDDGTEYVLTHEVLQALHMQQQQQEQEEQQHILDITNTGVNNDIIAVAMAGSDLYGNGVLTIDTSQALQLLDDSGGSVVFQQATSTPGLVQQHLTPPAVVTNAVLDQSPIMSTLEVPSNSRLQVPPHCIAAPSLPTDTPSNVVRSNLDDSLAAIGVTAQSSSISSSLGLPITVTDPNIASKVTSVGSLNDMLQLVSHRPATSQATAVALATAALAGESRIFND